MGKRKGWFRIEGVQDGDRTLEEQLRGLEVIDFRGQGVLDLGCAEGLIAHYALLNGAEFVDGAEIIEAHVKEARRQCAQFGARARFLHMDLARFDAEQFRSRYDVVLLLAILHKLRRPLDLLRQLASLSVGLYVVRLPAQGAGVISDERSGCVAYDVPAWFEGAGFDLERTSAGTFDEWVGYFRRRQ
jgi:SAM-dependent methyltransferase